MIYFNGDIKHIQYSGFTIDRIYACGGNLVWSGGTTPTPPIPPVGDKKVVGITTANTEWYGTDCSEGTSELLSHNISVPASAISASEVGTCITIIGSGAFTNSNNMTTLVLPNTISYIRNVMLGGCSSMQSLTVYATTPPTFYATGGGSISNCGLFSAERSPSEPPEPIPTGFVIYVPCDNVNDYKTADVWSRYADYIQPISGTCSSTTKFFATYNDSSTYSADCDSDTNLTTGITRNGGFSKYSRMTNATIGDCVTTIKTSAFYECLSLTSVTIPNSVTKIMGNAFNTCISLISVGTPGSGASVEIPSGVTSFDDGDEFGRCSGLTDVVIGDYITNISVNMFRDCSGLTNVNVGSGVTSVDGKAFQHCTGLTSVTINATTPPTAPVSTESNWLAFSNTNNCPIYVPDTSVNNYKAAYGWRLYANRIKPISEKP